jgi:hypothetical protein
MPTWFTDRTAARQSTRSGPASLNTIYCGRSIHGLWRSIAIEWAESLRPIVAQTTNGSF